MLASLRSLKAKVARADGGPVDAVLAAAAVPLAAADCRLCPDPCDDHEDYPRFDVDHESPLLGSVDPYRRQLVISTGKSDWERDVTATAGSLASLIVHARDAAGTPAALPQGPPLPKGLFRAADATRISILAGNHRSLAHDPAHDTVLVLPDFLLVSDIPRTRAGAQAFWDAAVSPARPAGALPPPGTGLASWVLPYSCVILLCSHKHRDNRCSITAPRLEHAFTHSLGAHGWETHTQPEHPHDAPLESLPAADAAAAAQRAALPGLRRALIVYTSHFGGHKYAGNVVIYMPQGAAVWYGRVTPHEVESIVRNTILDGKVLAPLLRAGGNIARPGCKSIHEW